MKINEIKETKEVLLRTEYIAEDGVVFYNEEECKKYEESALFAVRKQLKRVTDNISHCSLNENFNDEDLLEIFDIKDNKDLELLRRYLYLKMSKNGASESTIRQCFTAEAECRKDYTFDSVTPGHEVMIFWNYDEDWFWVYKDGSLNGFFEYTRERYQKIINQGKEKKQND